MATGNRPRPTILCDGFKYPDSPNSQHSGHGFQHPFCLPAAAGMRCLWDRGSPRWRLNGTPELTI